MVALREGKWTTCVVQINLVVRIIITMKLGEKKYLSRYVKTQLNLPSNITLHIVIFVLNSDNT